MFPGVEDGGKILMGLVAVQYDQLWVADAALCPVLEVHQPLQEQFAVRPSGGTGASDGSWGCPVHELVEQSLPWPDHHRRYVVPSGAASSNNCHKFTSLRACQRSDTSLPTLGQNLGRRLDSGHASLIHVPNLTALELQPIEKVLVDLEKPVHHGFVEASCPMDASSLRFSEA